MKVARVRNNEKFIRSDPCVPEKIWARVMFHGDSHQHPADVMLRWVHLTCASEMMIVYEPTQRMDMDLWIFIGSIWFTVIVPSTWATPWNLKSANHVRMGAIDVAFCQSWIRRRRWRSRKLSDCSANCRRKRTRKRTAPGDGNPLGGFHKGGYPKMDGSYGKIPLEWMI